MRWLMDQNYFGMGIIRDWFRFADRNRRLLNFGFLFNFFSSFGQTFFISLFVPFWVDSLNITNAAFGSIYAAITIVSALLLSQSGRYIDRMPLKKYGLIVFSGLLISVIILSRANSVGLLITGLLLVRWFGQGLMTHASSTGIAKHFEKDRGKALGFTALGHPAGQFILPLAVFQLISLTGWRMSLIYLSITAFAMVVPALLAIAPVTGFEPDLVGNNSKSRDKKVKYFKSLRFWIITANIFIIPFIGTAVFLYQYTIGKEKGWDASWVAFSFAFYPVFNALALLVSGNLVDRFSGRKLFPLYLVPAILALLSIPLIENKWVFPAFYCLLGISAGLGSTIKTAIQVEIYGTTNLGKIRSYFSTILVISTALGPPVFGFFMDRHISYDLILCISAIMVFMVMLLSFRVWDSKPFRSERGQGVI